ncbi:MAG: NADH-ubiquinone oxidoreductase-F iron-sulfur binding region domain-containing protein [Thermofilaceae archaeon]
MSWSLLDKCCEKCKHSLETPCPDVIECSLNGPLCHSNEECVQKRKVRIEQLHYGEKGAKIKVPWTSCTLATGAEAIYQVVVDYISKKGLDITVSISGCYGLDFIDPWIEFTAKDMPTVVYANVKESSVPKLIEKYFVNRDVSGAFALKERTGNTKGEDQIPLLSELDFWRKQYKWVSRNCGIVNPESLEEYIASGGYKGLSKALKIGPDAVIDEIQKSGLRGRGGAGFPTGLKWRITRQQRATPKYAIANADEGDPGAFMNRLLAESDPFRIVEGLTIAGYAVGASRGFIFVRAEKPLMARRLQRAVEEARKYGLLGMNILSSGFNFDIEVILSAGAFVCGEETALIAAIEGKRAWPRQRPPYPAEKGLWGQPTVINNVETLAHAATIMAEGAEKFSALGSDKTKGTKMFCVTGTVKRTGAYEVPIGVTIRTLVEELAGGAPEGAKIKAVQIGGPSGGCIPASLLDLQVDYETLQSAGAIMGSGGVVAISDENCMVDAAKFFLTFTSAESCGKCIPCRVGLRVMWSILDKITHGKGQEGDLEILKQLAETVRTTSLCALGGTAPNPVLSTLRYFMDEYEAHIKEKICPANVCATLITYSIDENICIGCGQCAMNCPTNAVSKLVSGKYSINQNSCIKCGTCYIICPVRAVKKASGSGGGRNG